MGATTEQDSLCCLLWGLNEWSPPSALPHSPSEPLTRTVPGAVVVSARDCRDVNEWLWWWHNRPGPSALLSNYPAVFTDNYQIIASGHDQHIWGGRHSPPPPTRFIIRNNCRLEEETDISALDISGNKTGEVEPPSCLHLTSNNYTSPCLPLARDEAMLVPIRQFDGPDWLTDCTWGPPTKTVCNECRAGSGVYSYTWPGHIRDNVARFMVQIIQARAVRGNQTLN